MNLRLLVPLCLPALLLTGCIPAPGAAPYMQLLDQRSFASGTPPTQDVRVLPPLPLVTIRFITPQTDFAPALDRAIDAAIARKADVELDVVLPLPPKVTPDEAMQRHATDIAHEIAERGVAPERIHIGVAQDQGAPIHELRIFAR